MKSLFLVFCATVALSAQELPSAPSATATEQVKQQVAPAAAPNSAPAQSPQDLVPAADDQPALKPLEPKRAEPKPARTAAAESAKKTTDPEEEPVDSDSLFKVTSNEVNVIFTVTDKRGRFIKDLTAEQIKVFDNKHPIDKLRSFSTETNLPLRVGLLIDASNSIRDRFKFEQEAAIEFLSQIVRREDKAFVLEFDSVPAITQELTNSTEKLANGIRQIRPGGGTALFDAVYYSSRDVLMKHRDRQTVRRAIILLSDGDDNQSRVTREEAIEMAQRAEVIIYTISTSGAPNSDNGDKVLERIADATGGRAFHPFRMQDVTNAFSDIQDELRSQYAVSYRPLDLVADGSYRSIDIQSPLKKYRVRSRKGYFAPRR